jgi:hypothetical protein
VQLMGRAVCHLVWGRTLCVKVRSALCRPSDGHVGASSTNQIFWSEARSSSTATTTTRNYSKYP